MAFKKCPHCGTTLWLGDVKKCPKCGADLAAPAATPVAPVSPTTVVSGPDQGSLDAPRPAPAPAPTPAPAPASTPKPSSRPAASAGPDQGALGAKPTLNGNILVYGFYPQSECKDRSIESQLWSADTDDHGYAVLNGKRYFQNYGKLWNVEPIEWVCIRKSGGDIVAVALHPLFCRQHGYGEPNNWEINGYLEGEFRKMAFGSGDTRVKSISVPSRPDIEAIPADQRGTPNGCSTPYSLAGGGCNNAIVTTTKIDGNIWMFLGENHWYTNGPSGTNSNCRPVIVIKP